MHIRFRSRRLSGYVPICSYAPLFFTCTNTRTFEQIKNTVKVSEERSIHMFKKCIRDTHTHTHKSTMYPSCIYLECPEYLRYCEQKKLHFQLLMKLCCMCRTSIVDTEDVLQIHSIR